MDKSRPQRQFFTPREAFHPHHVSHENIFDVSEYLILYYIFNSLSLF